MEINPIRTELDYDLALQRVNLIFDATPATQEFDELDKYEAIHYPIPVPDPIEAIRFMMEQNAMNDTDLGVLLNSRSRVSELFNKKRALTIKQIRILHDKLKIPAEILIKEYDLSE